MEWNTEEEEADLGMVKETIDSLKSKGGSTAASSTSCAELTDVGLSRKGVSFATQRDEPPPTEPSSEQLRAEDEELRKVLELSLQDQGGRGAHSEGAGLYGAGSSYGGASSSGPAATAAAPASSGYVPAAAAAASSAANTGINKNLPDPAVAQSSSTASFSTASAPAQAPAATSAAAAAPPDAHPPAASRVRALYDFAPTEEGELAFAKGDVIRVLDSVYEHWWRGELRGEAGIFPVNYVVSTC